MKVIIAGSRTIKDIEKVEKAFTKFREQYGRQVTEIVSGTADGADKLGERLASKLGIRVKRFPADWSIGRKAGHLRNMEMGDYADAAVVVWDGISRGAADMADVMNKLGKPCMLFMDGNEKGPREGQEQFHFGEVSVRVEEAGMNLYRCFCEEACIGIIEFEPDRKNPSGGGAGKSKYAAFGTPEMDARRKNPATEMYEYNSMRDAAQAVVARHFSGKTYTYIKNNIAVLDGKVVSEEVYKGRKRLKMTLTNR